MASRRVTVAACLIAFVAVSLTPSPASALARAEFPVQSVGNRGLDVAALQRLLRHHGLSIEVSGVFNAQTATALAAFQSAADLPADGIARAGTWQALVPSLAQGARGDAVVAVQEQLNGKRNAGLVVNGSYDTATGLAVEAFQRRLGLSPSGAMNVTTWRHLLWYFMRPATDGPLCGYELFAGRSAKWGTSATVAQLSAAADTLYQRSGARVPVGDLSRELGGPIAGHASHEVGLDVDLRTIRRDNRQCRWGVSHTARSYSRPLTRELIQAIYDSAPGHVKLIYFNDPVLIAEGLVRRRANHDAHIHVRYCEADHPRAAYRCPLSAGSAASLAAHAAMLDVAGDAAVAGPLTGSWPLLRIVLVE